jgi:hypothetical protein
MLYISPDHRENEEKVILLLRNKAINLTEIEDYIEKSLHRDQEELDLMKPTLTSDQLLKQKISLCQVEILLSSLRRLNLEPRPQI